jgi:hypothetical protein
MLLPLVHRLHRSGLTLAPLLAPTSRPAYTSLRCFAGKGKPREKEEGVYSKTVNLPQTAFDMRANSTVKEPALQAFWADNKVYETLSRENPGVGLFSDVTLIALVLY